jgi:hypothetical protein
MLGINLKLMAMGFPLARLRLRQCTLSLDPVTPPQRSPACTGEAKLEAGRGPKPCAAGCNGVRA